MDTKQQHYEKSYSKALGDGYTYYDANEIALESTKAYEPVVEGKKSFTVTQTKSDGNVLDVLFGYSGADAEALSGGSTLEYSGWNNVPSESFTGDINHYSYDLANGVANDLEDKWQNFTTKAKDFYTVQNNNVTELRGKVEVPNTDSGKEFIKAYDNGEFGVSIEYKGLQGNKFIEDWEMTGYTFDKNPSYDTKKSKDL